MPPHLTDRPAKLAYAADLIDSLLAATTPPPVLTAHAEAQLAAETSRVEAILIAEGATISARVLPDGGTEHGVWWLDLGVSSQFSARSALRRWVTKARAELDHGRRDIWSAA